eukprot:SAG31_NODE_2224_length_6150_cov_5.071724_3_plen_138_part_01
MFFVFLKRLRNPFPVCSLLSVSPPPCLGFVRFVPEVSVPSGGITCIQSGLSSGQNLKILRDSLQTDPMSFIGQSIFKDWGPQHGVAHGRVIKHWRRDTNNESLWTILYDDGDSEDCNSDEMFKYCIRRDDGNMISPPR